MGGIMRDLELTALAEEMWAITSDLFKFLQCRDRDAMTACGLSVAQCYSLDAIGTQGQLTLNELADSLYIAPSTASRTTEELVRKGLVERRQDVPDPHAARPSPVRGRAAASHRATTRHTAADRPQQPSGRSHRAAETFPGRQRPILLCRALGMGPIRAQP
jgi:MarR family